MSTSTITWSAVLKNDWWKGESNTGTTQEQFEREFGEKCYTALKSLEQSIGVPFATWEEARQKAKDNVSTMLKAMSGGLVFPLSSWTGTVQSSVHQDRPRVMAEIRTGDRRVWGMATEHEGRVC